jgi:hypothetical protein
MEKNYGHCVNISPHIWSFLCEELNRKPTDLLRTVLADWTEQRVKDNAAAKARRITASA